MRTFHRCTRLRPVLTAVFLILCGPTSRVDRADGAVPAAAGGLVLDRCLEALAVAESGNRGWIVHQDRDGRYYYGCLQFRESTFRYFVEKFKLAPNAEPAEVMNLMFDSAFEKRVAARMIRQDPGNWKHWRKTTGRIGLPPGATGSVDAAAADLSIHTPE
jgi:hypothetical protein